MYNALTFTPWNNITTHLITQAPTTTMMQGSYYSMEHKHCFILPLEVDSINENDSAANPDPTPRIASVHKSRFAEVVLVGCWIEAVYYGLLLFTIM